MPSMIRFWGIKVKKLLQRLPNAACRSSFFCFYF